MNLKSLSRKQRGTEQGVNPAADVAVAPSLMCDRICARNASSFLGALGASAVQPGFAR